MVLRHVEPLVYLSARCMKNPTGPHWLQAFMHLRDARFEARLWTLPNEVCFLVDQALRMCEETVLRQVRN